MVKSKPFKFTKMIPAKPEIQPMIFPGVNFSCLKIRLAISSEKNAEVPLKIVPFTPEVLAKPHVKKDVLQNRLKNTYLCNFTDIGFLGVQQLSAGDAVDQNSDNARKEKPHPANKICGRHVFFRQDSS